MDCATGCAMAAVAERHHRRQLDHLAGQRPHVELEEPIAERLPARLVVAEAEPLARPPHGLEVVASVASASLCKAR